MAIIDKSLMAAATQFSDHLNDILNRTMTLVRVVPIGRMASGRPSEQVTLTRAERIRYGPGSVGRSFR